MHEMELILRVIILWSLVIHHARIADARMTLQTSPDEGVVEGGLATFTCTYAPKVTSSRLFGGIYWKYSPHDSTSKTDIASYTPSNGPVYNSSWAPRLMLNASWQYGGVLTLSNVTLSDSGQYECQMSTFLGFAESTMSLTVYGIPSAISILDDGNQGYEDGATMELIEGRRHVVICSSSPPSTPSTNLTWELDTNLMTSSSSAQPRVEYFPMNVSPTQSSSSSSSSTRRYSSAIRLAITPEEGDDGSKISCYGNHPGLIQSLNTSVILSVKVPPDYVRMFDSSHLHHYPTGSAFEVTQGHPVTFACIASRSRPPAEITWRIGDDVIDGNATTVTSYNVPYQSSHNLFDVWSQMTLSSASREHHGKGVSCWASGAELQISTEVILRVIGPPDPPRITTNTLRLIEGQQHTFHCIANNGYPTPNMRWSVDGSPAAETSSTSELGWRYNTTSELILSPVRQMNGKRVTCLVERPQGMESTGEYSLLEDSVPLNVSFCPVSISMTCDAVAERNNGTLSCETSLGNPAPHVTWAIAGQPLSSTPRLSARDVASTLHPATVEGISGVRAESLYSTAYTAEDDGMEMRCCVARNEAFGCSTDVCQDCPMSIYYKPIMFQQSDGIVDLSPNDRTITFRCSARGNPAPAIEWYSPWMRARSPLDADVLGIVSIDDHVMEPVGDLPPDRVRQSTLVLDRAGSAEDTWIKGIKCVATNTMGYSSVARYMGTVSGLSVLYNDQTGIVTIMYHHTPVPSSATSPDVNAALENSPDANTAAQPKPCAHVDFRLRSTGRTCFELSDNRTLIQYDVGLDPADIGVRLCYFEEYCADSIQAKAEHPATSSSFTAYVVYSVFGVLAFLVTMLAVILVVIKCNRTTDHSKPDAGQSRSTRHGARRRQTIPVSAPVAAQRLSATNNGSRMNQYYMDMSCSRSVSCSPGYQGRIYENPSACSSPTNLSDTWQFFPAVKAQNTEDYVMKCGDAETAFSGNEHYENVDDDVHSNCRAMAIGPDGFILYEDMSFSECNSPTTPCTGNYGNSRDTAFPFDGYCAAPPQPPRTRSVGSMSSVSRSASANPRYQLASVYGGVTGFNRPAPAQSPPGNVDGADKEVTDTVVITYGPLLGKTEHGSPASSPATPISPFSDDGYFSIPEQRSMEEAEDGGPQKAFGGGEDQSVKVYANTSS